VVEEAGLHRALVPEEAGGFGVAVPDALSLLKVAGAYAVPLPLPRDDARKLATDRRLRATPAPPRHHLLLRARRHREEP
jgi:hypothetical protein